MALSLSLSQLLGDDVVVESPKHYQAIYRTFLDIQDRLGLSHDSWFGCPWWQDASFPNFPTFPCVGRAHFHIFGGLIPKIHRGRFVNQDLDPYLQRLYLGAAAGAAPQVPGARLDNLVGGGASEEARYRRISAADWRGWVSEGESLLGFLNQNTNAAQTFPDVRLVDIIVPSYRVELENLVGISTVDIPECWQTSIIIIVDSPERLCGRMGCGDPMAAARALEAYLSK